MAANKFLASCLGVAVTAATALSAAPVSAQSDGEVVALEEVIVTARKIEETLLDVPVAVASLSAADIENKGIESLADVALFTPGLTYFDSIQNQLGTPIIRGIAQTNLASPDRNVAIFYGGVYLSSTSAANLEILDVARIEVVRGPQSALYGRNAFNGAINYVPAEPTDQFFAKVEGTVGTDERYEGKLTLSGAITDRIGGRLAVSYNEFGGTYTNASAPQNNIGGYETKNLSGTVNFDATENLKFKLFGLYTDDHRDPSALWFYSANNCGPGGLPPLPMTAVCGAYAYNPVIRQNADAYGFDREVALGAFDVFYDIDTGSKLGKLSFVSQTALYDSKTQGFSEYSANGVGYTYPRILQSDIAALTVDPAIIAAAAMAGRTPAFQAWLSAPAMGTVQIPVFTGTRPVNTETFSQELRIETDRENRLRGSIGFFYFKNEYDNRAGLAFGGDNLAPGETFRDPLGFGFNFAAAISNDPRNSVVEAVNLARTDYQRAYFGSFEYDFFDNLTFGGELRKDKEDRRQFSRAAPTTSRQQRDFDYNTWRYHLDYGLSNTQKFYFSVAKGVISGHFNATFDTLARVPVPIELQGYNPAENRTHEIGWKAEWLDRRLSTEIALFHIKYSGLQVNATPPPPLINAIIQNIGKATSKGIETSVNWAITSKWRVGGTLTLSPTEFGQNAFDPSMTRYCAGGATVAQQQANLLRGFCPTTTFRGLLQPNVGGLSLPRAPESTGSLYVALNTPLAGEWSLNARVDGGYQSKAWGISSNLAWIPSRTLINARVGVKRGENLEIALWGRNITDEDYVSAVIFQPSFADGVTYPNVSQGEGSMFGLTASYRFGEGR